MRIYEGSPRQDWEEVLRCVGAYLDDRACAASFPRGRQGLHHPGHHGPGRPAPANRWAAPTARR